MLIRIYAGHWVAYLPWLAIYYLVRTRFKGVHSRPVARADVSDRFAASRADQSSSFSASRCKLVLQERIYVNGALVRQICNAKWHE